MSSDLYNADNLLDTAVLEDENMNNTTGTSNKKKKSKLFQSKEYEIAYNLQEINDDINAIKAYRNIIDNFIKNKKSSVDDQFLIKVIEASIKNIGMIYAKNDLLDDFQSFFYFYV